MIQHTRQSSATMVVVLTSLACSIVGLALGLAALIIALTPAPSPLAKSTTAAAATVERPVTAKAPKTVSATPTKAEKPVDDAKRAKDLEIAEEIERQADAERRRDLYATMFREAAAVRMANLLPRDQIAGPAACTFIEESSAKGVTLDQLRYAMRFAPEWTIAKKAEAGLDVAVDKQILFRQYLDLFITDPRFQGLLTDPHFEQVLAIGVAAGVPMLTD